MIRLAFCHSSLLLTDPYFVYFYLMDQKPIKSKNAGRAKETLFRVSYQHQSKLIQIADYKANMNISLCTMIISAIIAIIGYGVVSGKIGDFNTTMIIPVALIILSCLASLIFAIQAARPKLLEINETKDAEHKRSLLFFGVISGYTQKDYLDRMKGLIESDDDMYEHMTIDLHNQGVILKRKYDLLLYSYQVLMYGFIISVVIFFVLFIGRFG